MKVLETTQYKVSTFGSDGVTYKDNRYMGIKVDADNPFEFIELGSKVNIGSIRSVVHRDAALEVLGPMVLTVVFVLHNEIVVTPSIIAGGDYLNASGIPCKGDEIVKLA